MTVSDIENIETSIFPLFFSVESTLINNFFRIKSYLPWLPMLVGNAKEAQHLKWAYYQLLLHLPECPLLLALFHTETVLHFHCPAGVGSVV